MSFGSKSEILFFAFRAIFESIPLGSTTKASNGTIRVGELPRGTIREVGVVEAIVVKVGQLHGPRPIGVGQTGKVGRFLETCGSAVEIKGIAHVLAGTGILKKPPAVSHRSHVHFLVEVGPRGHVGNKEIEEPVVVEIGKVGTH